MNELIKDLGLLINATLIATPPLLLAALGFFYRFLYHRLAVQAACICAIIRHNTLIFRI